LEQAGSFRLVRPALNAFWKPSLPVREWEKAHGVYERNSSGGGKWAWRNGGVPESWVVEWGGFKLTVKPTSFGHLGFFAEQHDNWEWIKKTIASCKDTPKTLNLFAYSGVGSMAMAQAGAEVCHLDASKGMIDWGRQNLGLNPQVPAHIRWIADDVIKFIAREVRRGSKYNGIALDPPSFGRGPQGQVWKMEDQISELLESCKKLIDASRPWFIVLSCHSPGFSPLALERVLSDVFGAGGLTESGEMTVPESAGKLFPAGIFARHSKS
jgi:23S rRNA (cytosine1962-C5)-methyltransferase